MKFKKLIAASAVALAAALPAAAEELSFANFTPPFHTINASVMEKLDTILSEATNGEVTVRGYHGGELGAGPVEQYIRVVQGVADMGWGLPGYTSSQFEKTMIVELPGTLTNEDDGYAAMWTAYDDHLAGEFPGTVPVALWTSEPNVFIMRDAVIRTPADLEGLKIRVAGATAADVATALGATPVQMPINQVYNALQTGLIDGVITGSSTLNDFKLDEVANSYTFGANLGRLSFYAVMTEGTYNGLSDEAKAVLDNSSNQTVSQSAEDAWNATADAGVATARALSENTFVDLTPEEATAFADAIAGVTGAYVDGVGGADALAAMQAN
ncbi:MAG: TRAP transporter substrate-binding protein [Pacificibacter sp.]|jgi:TRAP-type C4-dicarboxylate transport system substrate-binding protein|nr:TRAP transporter substrate-binding protein [Amylibacter sp.]MDC1347742.1 TRAP transporter substrate-binding protein [Amylibacter sp.]MDC1410612.1 TRAP transporter substrate-binding protein [Amylibacter sp.]HBS37253.1 C4-dicarboxylate ABC transporter substrate-binding protein [Paracoccaceae bacterium]HCW86375.1 C4-dicarboxylate ABC transporter substrate-binding protein [Paracoccaceae bacterium]